MSESPRKNLAARAGHWSATHKKTAIFGWLAFVILSVVIGGAVGTKNLKDADEGAGESRSADRAIDKADFPDRASEQVFIQSRDGKLTVKDPKFVKAVNDTVTELKGQPEVKNLKSPLDPANADQVTKDGKSALVTYELPDPDKRPAADHLGGVLKAIAAAQDKNEDVRVEAFGDATADHALSKAMGDDFSKAETLSLPITLLILVVAFGALAAAGVPLLLALSAVFATLGLLGPITQIAPADESISSVILLIGLAVGVDYSLFYLRRAREERAAGNTNAAAIDAAAATSGHAVLVSGLTVLIAMAGMYVSGNAVFSSFATGTMLVVAVAMLGSISVLPAILAALGDKIEKGRVPFLARRRKNAGGESRFWRGILRVTLAKPAISAVLSVAVLVVLALPALKLHTQNLGVQGLPRDLPVMQTYDRIQAAFPGGPLPATVAVSAADVTTPQVKQGIDKLEQKARAEGFATGPITVDVAPDHTVAKVDVPIAGSGTDKTSIHALDKLRNEIVPQTVGAIPSVKAQVTGYTAGSKDFNDQMTSHLPYVFAFVLGMAFLLLLVTFRSIVIPIKAIVLNLLSVGASYGVLTYIFQEGHFEKQLDFKAVGGITSWLPLFLFVVLFGLSMDYHVFILSRIREAVDRGKSTDEAVRHGIAATAGVVTSAAFVMVAVFAVFATLSALDFKMMGVGLAVAVLIDATIVRAVLLPATMKLLGEWNWYLPRGLRWLPKISAEPRMVQQAR